MTDSTLHPPYAPAPLAASPAEAPRPTYRPDIDGLRAVAVLLVLADHLHLRFTGGYVGVDVFFVISGYLISSVILAGLRAGNFSIARFYERRIRRIFPALVVMLLLTCLLAYRYDTPVELQALGPTLLAALLSFSNILFWRQAGYFDAPSALKPLLHTWSLGVEEQFYIVFPLFLLAVRRWLPASSSQSQSSVRVGRIPEAHPAGTRNAIWLVTLVTFLFAAVWAYRDPSATYFLAPLRAWELLIGTVVSQHYLPSIRTAFHRNLFSASGLLLILAPALLYTPLTVFPGIAALPPCLGAAFIIAAGETGTSVVGRLLSLRPVVFIGLISYSLYLLHWPLIVFQNSANILHLRPGGHGAALILAAVSLALATLSWRFVETPYRAGPLRPGNRTLLIQTCVAVIVITAIAAGLIATRGLPSRFPADAQQVAGYMAYAEAVPFRENVCFLVAPASTFESFNQTICLPQPAPGQKSFLVLGDSHAAALYAGIAASYPGVSVGQASAAGCRPFTPGPAGRPADPSVDANCRRLLAYIFNSYLTLHRPDAILLVGRWQPADLDRIANTVARLRALRQNPILLGPVTEFDAPLPRVLAAALRDRRPQQVDPHRSAATQSLDRQLASLASSQWHVPYVSMYADLCTPACPAYVAPGVPLLFDMDHLTSAGAAFFARAMRARNQLP